MSALDDDWLAIAGRLEKDFEGLPASILAEMSARRKALADRVWFTLGIGLRGMELHEEHVHMPFTEPT